MITSGVFNCRRVLQPVIPIDDATIEIVQIGGGKTASLERNKWAQIRRDDREHVENHPLGTGLRVHEALDQLQSLGELLPELFAAGSSHLLLNLVVQILQVRLLKQLLNGFGTHSRDKNIAVLVLRFAKFRLGQELALLQRGISWDR